MKNVSKQMVVLGLSAIIIVLAFAGCEQSTDPGKQPVAKPSAKPATGVVASGTMVTLSTTTTGAEIWYTTNGSAPARNGTDSTTYTTPIAITATVTIKAIAVKDGMNDSAVLEATYTIVAAKPAVDPAAGAVASGTTVTLSTTTTDAEIWYTTNGAVPAKEGSDSTQYTTPIVITAAVTIKAITVKDGMNDSAVLEAKYTIQAEPPVILTVTFDKNTQAAVTRMPAPLTNVVKGNKISKPTSEPTRSNNSTPFEGWLKPDKTALWDFANDTVTDNITLYAKWGPEVIAERNYYADFKDNIAQWAFTIEELDTADYFIFHTDGSRQGAKTNGFGGIKIGFQNNSGNYGMSTGLTTPEWTSFAGRTGKCIFVVNLKTIENYKADNGDYVGATSGEVRIYLGYWPNISELALNGYATLVRGDVVKPLYSIDLNLIETGGVIGFVYRSP